MATIEFKGVTKEFGDGTLAVRELDLSVADGELLILVGPSGCGKTTTLRMLAGFEKVSSGTIEIGGQPAQDLDPRDRGVAMVFQSYALYPHMTVEQNIAFPLRMRREVPKGEIRERVHEVAELLGLREQLGRRPYQLSGGQRQRVAMGRAIVRQPQAFLMDEPLSNLDAKLRVRMRAELMRLHQRLGVTTVYVTHDQTEAMTLGDRVAVLRDGVLQQVASPQELYECPANIFVAGFVGSPAMNFLEGTIGPDGLRVAGTTVPLAARYAGVRPGPVIVGVRPEIFEHVNGEGPGTKPVFAARVEVVESIGPELFVYLRLDGGAAVEVGEVGEQQVELSGACVARMDRGVAGALLADHRLDVTVDPELLQLFDAESGVALGA